MKPEQLQALIQYRMEQATDTLNEAEILRDASAWRGSVSRAYYAMFYAVLALLATRQLGTSKHSGAIALFDRKFVKEGIFSRDMSRSLHFAFDRRQIHDYGEWYQISSQDADQSVTDAQTFIDEITVYLRTEGYL